MSELADVLEVMAEELNERRADVLASFLKFDGDGRRKLDGMSKGRRWDIDREQREFEKTNARDYGTLRSRRWRRVHPDRSRELAEASAKRWKERDPKSFYAARTRAVKKWAKRHPEKAKAGGRRRASRRYLRLHPDARKLKCGACGERGHNRRTCTAREKGGDR